jgi:hypothetical protein
MDGFVRVNQGVIHAAGSGTYDHRDGFNADAWSAQNGGMEHRVCPEGGSEFRRSTFSDESNPVFARFARRGVHRHWPHFGKWSPNIGRPLRDSVWIASS